MKIFNEKININHSFDTYQNSNYEKFRHYERFKFLIKEMEKSLKTATSLLDIGCAKGELIYFLKEKYPCIDYWGLEYSIDLLNKAKEEPFLKSVNFIHGDAKNFNLKQEFDIVVMSGVLPIFDDIETVLMNMLKHIKIGGVGYLFGHFNEKDIDVIVRYRNNIKNSTIWESGWNIFSINTIKKTISGKTSNFISKKFEIPIDIPEQNDPVKSFTVKLDNGKRLILTGGGIVNNFYLISFKKRKG